MKMRRPQEVPVSAGGSMEFHYFPTVKSQLDAAISALARSLAALPSVIRRGENSRFRTTDPSSSLSLSLQIALNVESSLESWTDTD